MNVTALILPAAAVVRERVAVLVTIVVDAASTGARGVFATAVRPLFERRKSEGAIYAVMVKRSARFTVSLVFPIEAHLFVPKTDHILNTMGDRHNRFSSRPVLYKRGQDKYGRCSHLVRS